MISYKLQLTREKYTIIVFHLFELEGKPMGEENLEFGLSNTMISIATSTGVQNWLKFILTLVTAIQMSTQLAHNYDPKENMDDLFSICIKNLWLIFW